MTHSPTPSPSDPVESESHLSHVNRDDSILSGGLTAGDRVRVSVLPPYIKTADTMPMLRPAALLAVGEEGVIVNRRSADYWVVQFKAGTFLMENQYLEKCAKTNS